MMQAMITPNGGSRDRMERARGELFKNVTSRDTRGEALERDDEEFDRARHLVHTALARMDEEIQALRAVAVRRAAGADR